MFIPALAFGAVAVLAAWPASAQPAAEAAANWGLIGVWQADCAGVPSAANPRSAFEVRDGALVYERLIGQDTDTDAIPGAVIRPDGAIALTINFASAGGTREWVLAKIDSSRFRTISNRGLASGVYTVRDGVLLGTGQPTPWNYRCQ